MKLSQAIREGAEISIEITDHCLLIGSDLFQSDAIGAALLAADADIQNDFAFWSKRIGHQQSTIDMLCCSRFEFIFDKQVQERPQLVLEILKLSEAGQTRESIADWLESMGY